jgi:hypothetical protein
MLYGGLYPVPVTPIPYLIKGNSFGDRGRTAFLLSHVRSGIKEFSDSGLGAHRIQMTPEISNIIFSGFICEAKGISRPVFFRFSVGLQ